MAEAVTIASLIGALVPLFWGVMAFLLFNLRESLASRMFWAAVHITCPSWIIQGSKSLVLTPLLNALLYGSFTAIFMLVRRLGRA